MKYVSPIQVVLSICLTILIVLSGQAFLSSHKQTMIDEHMSENINRIQTSYKLILQTFQIAAKKDFYHITHNPKVIALLTEFKGADEPRKSELRGLLYRELISDYKFMRELGVRQFHFHTHLGESLLRFHHPSKNGDSLLDIRPSVRLANTKYKEVIGFEGGRIFPGFRYVFPILHNNVHLGSVEFSVSFEAIEEKLRNIFPSIGTQLIMTAENSQKLTFNSTKDYFEVASCHPNYYIETSKLSEINRSMESNELIETIKKSLKNSVDIQRRMDEIKPFYIPVSIEPETYMVTFVPFDNVFGEHAGFITFYQNFQQMKLINGIYHNFQFVLYIVAVGFFAFFNMIWSLQANSLALKRRLVQKNAMMEEAQGVAHFGSWELFVPENKVIWSREARKIIGLDSSSLFTFDDFIACVPLDEQDKVKSTYKESIAARQQYFSQHRLIHRKNGSVKVVEAFGRHRYDPRGNHIATVGTLYDMTKNAEAFERLKKIIDTQKAIAVLSTGKMFTFANQSFLKFFGFSSIDGFKKHYNCICQRFIDDISFFSLNKVKPDEAHWIESLLNLSERERVVMMNDFLGRPRAFSVSISDFDKGTFMVLFTDITDNMKEKIEIQNQLNKDELTQVYSRHFLINNAQNIVEKIERENGQQVCLFYLDIDHFKPINDKFGHATGDRVLKGFAQIVSGELRDDDFLIRLGGEEFLIVLGCHSIWDAENIATKILKHVNRHHFDEVGQLSCSIGLVTLKDRELLEQAINRADECMYEAKQSGRNRVVVG